MAFMSSDPDCRSYQSEMCSGRVSKPKHPVFVAGKTIWDLFMLVCHLSTSVVDLSDFGSWKKYGEALLGMKACVYAGKMMI